MMKYSNLYFLFFFFMSIWLQGQNKELLSEDVINTPLNERDFAISPAGNEVLFTRSHFDHKTRVILSSKKVGGEFAKPIVAGFSGEFNDLEPFFSPDGRRVYFASNRNREQTAEKGDYDIWYVEKQPNGDWGQAKQLPSIINSDKDEFYPSVTSNGNLYFTGVRANGIGTEDIFLSPLINGQYQEPKPLSENINSKTYEFNAYVNPSEDLIVFTSYGRADDLGGGDLYYSVKDAKGHWKKAVHLGEEVNTESLDYCPFYDSSSDILYFTSNIGKDKLKVTKVEDLMKIANGTMNGYGNIYQIRLPKEFWK